MFTGSQAEKGAFQKFPHRLGHFIASAQGKNPSGTQAGGKPGCRDHGSEKRGVIPQTLASPGWAGTPHPHQLSPWCPPQPDWLGWHHWARPLQGCLGWTTHTGGASLTCWCQGGSPTARTAQASHTSPLTTAGLQAQQLPLHPRPVLPYPGATAGAACKIPLGFYSSQKLLF